MARRLSRDPKYSTCFCKAATCACKSAITRCCSSTEEAVALGVAVWLVMLRGKQVKQTLRIVARMGCNCQSFFMTLEVYQRVPLSTTLCTLTTAGCGGALAVWYGLGPAQIHAIRPFRALRRDFSITGIR